MSRLNKLLGRIAEPETPEDRDEAWDEISAQLRRQHEQEGFLRYLIVCADHPSFDLKAHVPRIQRLLGDDKSKLMGPMLRAALVELGMPADPEGQVGRVRNGFYDPAGWPGIQAHADVPMPTTTVLVDGKEVGILKDFQLSPERVGGVVSINPSPCLDIYNVGSTKTVPLKMERFAMSKRWWNANFNEEFPEGVEDLDAIASGGEE